MQFFHYLCSRKTIKHELSYKHKSITTMKKILVLAVLAAMLVGCSSGGSKRETINGLPVQTEYNGFWGFVDANGRIFMRSTFKECPSAIIDGLFTTFDGEETYRLCRTKGEGYEVILDDLAWAGIPSHGLVPVTRRNGKIEVVDKNGKNVFTLPSDVLGCSSSFVNGNLVYWGIDGKNMAGVVNEKGEEVLERKYYQVAVFGEDLFYLKLSEDAEKCVMINSKGEVQTQWPDNLTYYRYNWNIANYVENPYVIGLDENKRYFIFDKTGKLVLECPENVKSITQFCDNRFIFKSNSRQGVMDINGKLIIDGLDEAVLTSKGIFSIGSWSIKRYSFNGDFQEELPRESHVSYWSISDISGFGLIRYTGSDVQVFDADLKPKGDQFRMTLDKPFAPYLSAVWTDYFDVAGVVKAAAEIFESMEENGWEVGKRLVDIKNVEKGQKAFDRAYDQFIKEYARERFVIRTVCEADVMRKVYVMKDVEEYDWWRGEYVTKKQRTYDHDELNPDAKIKCPYIFILPTAYSGRKVSETRGIDQSQILMDAIVAHYEAQGYTITPEEKEPEGKEFYLKKDGRVIDLYNAGEYLCATSELEEE